MAALAELIKSERVEILFHPVVSVRKKALIGFKAVAALEAEGRRVATTRDLLDQADREGVRLELDRLFRKKALEAFRPVRKKDPGLLLFLNIDTAIFDMGVVGSGRLQNLVEANELDPTNVVIEFTESGVRDVEALKRFLEQYRAHGFLIALDGVGSGHSNLDRMTLTRPDIMKIGGPLVRGLDRDHYKREVLKAFTNLSRKLGALVVASGIERPEEAVAALEAGVDMLEEPTLVGAQELEAYSGDGPSSRIAAVAAQLKDNSVQRMNAEKKMYRNYEKIVSDLLKELASASADTFDAKMKDLLEKQPEFECVYILDEDGVQLTETIFAPGRAYKRNSLFQPAQKGADHSSKDYFYLLTDTFVSRFTTEPYVSLASGTLCFTITSLFRDAQNHQRVFCADIPLT